MSSDGIKKIVKGHPQDFTIIQYMKACDDDGLFYQIEKLADGRICVSLSDKQVTNCINLIQFAHELHHVAFFHALEKYKGFDFCMS